MEILKKTAEFRVKKQTENKPVEQVTSLSLSGVPALPDLWSRYTHLTHLFLVCMKPKLTGLDGIGLQLLPALRVLDVSDNAITIAAAPPPVPTLARLLMPNNSIVSVAEVDLLAGSFPNLTVLDLADNRVDTPSHFAEVFVKFPKLIALNSRTRDGTEVIVADSDESGSEEEEDEEEYTEDDDDSDGEGEEEEEEEVEDEEVEDEEDGEEEEGDDEESDETSSENNDGNEGRGEPAAKRVRQEKW